jgi:hypothetical protein
VTTSLKVTVCTWEPQHTLDLIEVQQAAVQDGSLVKLIKKHGRGTDALRAAMVKANLVSVKTSERGEPTCPECGALMESVLARGGITDRADAVRDVVQDFDKAIERTRKAR